MTAYEKVTAARDSKKLTAVDYIKYMFGDSFFELHGDRRFSDDKAVVAGLAMLYDMPVTVIGIEKDATPESVWSATSDRLTQKVTARL